MEIKFHIPIEPEAKGRPRFSRRSGHVYTPQNTREYEYRLKTHFAQYKHVFIDTYNSPLKIHVHFFLSKPISVKRDYPSVRPDIDNYLKAVLDAMNGIVFKDDGQIITLAASKRYHDNPGIDFWIEPVKES